MTSSSTQGAGRVTSPAGDITAYRDLGHKGRKRLRYALRERDGDKCHWCGKPMEFGVQQHHRPLMATIEHLVSRLEGGTEDMTNLVLAHRICNQKRTLDPTTTTGAV